MVVIVQPLKLDCVVSIHRLHKPQSKDTQVGILADTISQQELVHVTEKSQGNDMRPKPSGS